MKDIFESLINIADRLDKKGYDRQADMVDAVAKTLLSNITTDKIQDQDAPIKVKQEQNKLSKDFNRVRKLIVDDENIKDLFDAKEELTKMKNSREYHLNDNEWSYVYEQILEDKFKRDYEKKSSQKLEEELNFPHLCSRDKLYLLWNLFFHKN